MLSAEFSERPPREHRAEGGGKKWATYHCRETELDTGSEATAKALRVRTIKRTNCTGVLWAEEGWERTQSEDEKQDHAGQEKEYEHHSKCDGSHRGALGRWVTQHSWHAFKSRSLTVWGHCAAENKGCSGDLWEGYAVEEAWSRVGIE